jgi:hypothetical protein
MSLMMKVTAAASILFAAVLGGCGGKSFKALDMSVGPPAGTATSSTTYKVDIVGVSDADAKEIEGVNPAEWFASSGPGAQKRAKFRSATKSLEIRAGTGVQAVKPSDPIWSTWRASHVTKLKVIVDPPPGTTPDPSTWTRDVTPMSQTYENDEIKVWVDTGGVRLDRSPLPEKS